MNIPAAGDRKGGVGHFLRLRPKLGSKCVCDVQQMRGVPWFHLLGRCWNQDGVFQFGEGMLDVEQHAGLQHTGGPETWNQHFMWDQITEVFTLQWTYFTNGL